MKTKHIVIIYLISEITLIIGATFKVLHFQGAPELIIVSSILKTLVALLAIWKVMTTEKYREFLNS